MKANAKVAENLYRKATGEGREAVTAAIFWLKTRAGWRETAQAHEVGVYDLSKIPDQELDRMLIAVRAMMPEVEDLSSEHDE